MIEFKYLQLSFLGVKWWNALVVQAGAAPARYRPPCWCSNLPHSIRRQLLSPPPRYMAEENNWSLRGWSSEKRNPARNKRQSKFLPFCLRGPHCLNMGCLNTAGKMAFILSVPLNGYTTVWPPWWCFPRSYWWWGTYCWLAPALKITGTWEPGASNDVMDAPS